MEQTLEFYSTTAVLLISERNVGRMLVIWDTQKVISNAMARRLSVRMHGRFHR